VECRSIFLKRRQSQAESSKGVGDLEAPCTKRRILFFVLVSAKENAHQFGSSLTLPQTLLAGLPVIPSPVEPVRLDK
jgi:hypothetical protein